MRPVTEAAAEIMDYRERFVGFLKSFQDKSSAFKYRETIATLATQGKVSLVIDFDDLISFDPDLAHDLKEKPNELLPKFNSAIADAMRVENMQYASKVKAFKSRFRKLDEVIPLRTLKSYHMGKLIMVEGIITRASGVKQLLKSAMFQCPRCGEKMIVDQTGSVLVPPPQCANQDCARKGFFRLITEESAFVDWQLISIQEKPEELPPGQLPRTVEGMLQGDIVDLSRPGDRISMVGVLQAKQEFTSKGFRLATFSSGIDANYLEVSERGSEELNISPDDEKKIKALAKDPQLYTKLIGSIAPSIYGYDEIKEAVAYQLVGGVSKNFSDIKIRGDINLLLVGDPGTAKSQLLQYVSKIAPRGVYTSGKGSTAAGLTATVVRDKNTGEFFLEAGALVIADKGIACMHPDSRVFIAGEQVRVGDLAAGLAFEPIIAGGALSEVAALGKPTLSLDLNEMSAGWREATRVRRRIHSGQIVKLHLRSGSIVKVTPDHLLLDKALAWRKASALNIGDALVATPPSLASGRAEGAPSYDEIKRVEREAYDGYVYDLMMTGEPHNYLSDGVFSHNCIDEIDKMRPEDRSAIHEAMEQQTISIAKAGIVVQLNARSSILAAANPTFGRYVPQRSIAENISDLPVTILSRFDLIFRLIDRPEETRDRNMTEHILKLHQGIRTSKMALIEPSFLKKFIYYIRQYGAPVLGDAASAAIQKYFLETRAKGQAADSPVPITMRQLEAAIRLSEARAKLALKKEVTEEDVNAATRLLKACLADVGTDSQTGTPDIDVIMVGHSKSTGDKMQVIFELYTKMERENEGRPVKREQFVSRAVTEGMNKGFVEKIIGDWIQQGILYEPRAGELKKV